MARKKRLEEVKEAPVETPKEPVFYQDAFQEKANKQIVELSKKVEGKGKTILYALAAVAVLAVLVVLISKWSGSSSSAGQAALGKAIETSLAPVTTQPLPPTYTGKAFKSEKERAEAAVAEFQTVSTNFGGDIRNKALYFAAVNKLSVDRGAAMQDLEGLTKIAGETGTLAKFALAQAKQGDGKLDEAAALYQEIAKSADSVVAKDTVNFQLAAIFEKQGKKTEAADIYFAIADAASKAKDSDGKAIPMSQTARESKDKLQNLDPAKAGQIKEDSPSFTPPA